MAVMFFRHSVHLNYLMWCAHYQITVIPPKQAVANANLFLLNSLPYTFCLMAIKLI